MSPEQQAAVARLEAKTTPGAAISADTWTFGIILADVRLVLAALSAAELTIASMTTVLAAERAGRLAAEARGAWLDRRRRSLEAALRVARGYVLGGLALPVGIPRDADIRTVDEALGLVAHGSSTSRIVAHEQACGDRQFAPTEASGSAPDA